MSPVQSRAIEKRERFVAAASRVIHRQGYANTTLARIAREAKQPAGSLFYHFRTKESVVDAIAAARLEELESRFEAWKRRRSPQSRLRELIQVWVDDREADARYGCPIGSLCYELGKQRSAEDNPAAEPVRRLLEWTEAQFRAIGGGPKRARDRAAHLHAALQGISLLANAVGDPKLILNEARALQRWVDSL